MGAQMHGTKPSSLSERFAFTSTGNSASNRFVPMSSPEINGSPQLELVLSYLQGIQKGDMNRVGKTTHMDHRLLTYTESAGKAVQDKEYLQHVGGIPSLRTEDRKVNHMTAAHFIAPG